MLTAHDPHEEGLEEDIRQVLIDMAGGKVGPHPPPPPPSSSREMVAEPSHTIAHIIKVLYMTPDETTEFFGCTTTAEGAVLGRVVHRIVREQAALHGMVCGGWLATFSTAKFLDDEQNSNPAHMHMLALLYALINVHVSAKHGVGIIQTSEDGDNIKLPNPDVFLQIVRGAAFPAIDAEMEKAQRVASRAEDAVAPIDASSLFASASAQVDRIFNTALTDILYLGQTKPVTKSTEYFGVMQAVNFVLRAAGADLESKEVAEVIQLTQEVVNNQPQLQQICRVSEGRRGLGVTF